jgi:hypothetical protein
MEHTPDTVVVVAVVVATSIAVGIFVIIAFAIQGL